MRNRKKMFFVQASLIIFVAAGLFLPVLIGAGNLEPSADPAATMHTLEDIYTLVDNINALVDPGPCGPCDPTGAGVERTGQTTSYQTGDDGDLEIGIEWPDPRFSDNGDGTVTDFLTGLIWLKNANCFGPKTWPSALADCNSLDSDNCGLSDGSLAGDWRLPNVKEFQSLMDYGQVNPILPNPNPFTGVQTTYWSSTTYRGNTNMAWGVNMSTGLINQYDNADVGYGGAGASLYVWPVRDDN